VLLLRVNVFQVWIVNEFLFLFFILLLVMFDDGVEGLIIYFFFQRFMSFIVFIRFVYIWGDILKWLLVAKLGVAPLHFWIVIISVKVALLSNVFIMGLQKMGVVWIIWLMVELDMWFVVLIVILGVLVSFIRVFNVRDLWLLMVYSSVANTGLIIFSMMSRKFYVVFFLYLVIFVLMMRLLIFVKSYEYGYVVMLLLMTTPRFLLFIYKFELFLRVLFSLKVLWFVVFLDILILVYYFNMIFMRLMIGRGGGFMVVMFFVMILGGLIFRI